MEEKKSKTLFDGFLAIVDHCGQILNLEPWILNELKTPARPPIIIPFTVPMDDGVEEEFVVYCSKYNEKAGVFKGGLRAKRENNIALLLDTLTLLSGEMVFKFGGADIPFGGAKSWLNIDYKDPRIHRNGERIFKWMTRAFGNEIGPEEYVPAPDIGTGPQEMDWIMDAYQQLHKDARYWGVVTGKSLRLHGCPGRDTATARGAQFVLRQLIRDAKKFGCPLSEIKGLKVVVHGFGNAGYHFARRIQDDGAIIIAVGDSKGGILNPNGLEVGALKIHKNHTRSVINFSGGRNITNEELLTLRCDVLALAAKEGVITPLNAEDTNEIVRLELANSPTVPETDVISMRKKITIMPDILTNVGGGAVSHFEWSQNLPGQQWTPEEIDVRLEYIMNTYTYNVLKTAQEFGVSNRFGAYLVAIKNLAETIRSRGQYKLPTQTH